MTRELAAYFFVTEFKDAEELDNIPAALNRATRFINAMGDLLNQLDELTEDATEEEIQFIYYEVGKAFYGTDKDSLRNFFKDIYLLLFGQTAAGRIGTLTKFMGLDDFINRIRDRLNDPFDIRGNVRTYKKIAHIKVQNKR